MLTILLVDDHSLFRQGIAALFDSQPDIQVVGQSGSVAEAVAETRKSHPDVILMDFHLPDGTGLDATRLILDELPETKIIFLTINSDDQRLFDAIRYGAKGFLQKNVAVDKLLKYIRGVQQGEAAITPFDTRRLMTAFAKTRPAKTTQSPASANVSEHDLTMREIEVLAELAQGFSNKAIAQKLLIAENTVKNHVRNILAKLNLNNRREAANYARRHRLTSSR